MTSEATVRKSPQVSGNYLPQIISGQSKQVSGNTPTPPPFGGGELGGEFPDTFATPTPKNGQPEFPDTFPDTCPKLTFFVPMKPVPQDRPRACVRRNGRAGSYDSGKADDWKAAVRWCADQAMRSIGFRMILGAVRLTMIFTMPRPKDHFRKNGTLKPRAPRYLKQKPDLDNLEKGTKDAMTAAGVWRDDSLVVEKLTLKQWAEPGQDTGCAVQAENLEPSLAPEPATPWKR